MVDDGINNGLRMSPAIHSSSSRLLMLLQLTQSTMEYNASGDVRDGSWLSSSWAAAAAAVAAVAAAAAAAAAA